MRIIEPYTEILAPAPFTRDAAMPTLKLIEAAARTCYKSEGKTTDDSAPDFVRKIACVFKHESVIEHSSVTVRFVVDRGISHELVRHRLAAFSQESTRYVHSVDKSKPTVATVDDVVREYKAGASMRRVAELSSGRYNEWQVYKVLNDFDVERRPLGNTGNIDHNFFDIIDTAAKAYLLGLIQADGSVRRDGSPQVTITQRQGVSWYIQRMVRDFIRPSATRASDKGCHSVGFTSPQLHSALLEKGVVPNKSYDQTDEDALRLWRAIPRHLVPSFLRGLLDGDGCVRFYKQKNAGETDSCRVEWNCHKTLAECIQTWLAEEFQYSAAVKPRHGTERLHHVYVTQPQVGELVVKRMLADFVFPYGHPIKTSRMIERVGGTYPTAEWGDQSFKVIRPFFFFEQLCPESWIWAESVSNSEDAYTRLIALGAKPQEARSVLPNSLKTEVVMTCNLRQWRHVFRLRCATNAHPQMRQVMVPLNNQFAEIIPELFDPAEL